MTEKNKEQPDEPETAQDSARSSAAIVMCDVEIIEGVGGEWSVFINEYRVCGSVRYYDGRVIKKWRASVNIIQAALPPATKIVAGNQRDEFETCDYCRFQEGSHYCCFHSRPMKNMDKEYCPNWEEKQDSSCRTYIRT